MYCPRSKHVQSNTYPPFRCQVVNRHTGARNVVRQAISCPHSRIDSRLPPVHSLSASVKTETTQQPALCSERKMFILVAIMLHVWFKKRHAASYTIIITVFIYITAANSKLNSLVANKIKIESIQRRVNTNSYYMLLQFKHSTPVLASQSRARWPLPPP